MKCWRLLNLMHVWCCSCPTKEGFFQVPLLRSLQDGKEEDHYHRSEARHTLIKKRKCITNPLCIELGIQPIAENIAGNIEWLFWGKSYHHQHGTHNTHKHKSCGYMVSDHTMVLIQPHFFRLDFTDKRRKLFCKAERNEKKIVRKILCTQRHCFPNRKKVRSLNILTGTQTKVEYGWKPQRGHLAIVSPSCFLFLEELWED